MKSIQSNEIELLFTLLQQKDEKKFHLKLLPFQIG